MLVPNRLRLDAHVADEFRRNSNRQVVCCPPVAVFSQWAEELLVRIEMLEGKATRGSIPVPELEQLWAGILGSKMGLLTPGDRRLAARQARTASRMLHHWWPDEPKPRMQNTFWVAEQAVAEQLSRIGMQTPEGWLHDLATRLLSRRDLPITLPERVQLDGFMEITPLENQVLEGLKQRGVALETAPESNPEPGNIGLVSFCSAEEELAAAACWAQDQVHLGRSRIAVVINQLDQMAELVRRVFENILCTDQRLALQDLDNCPFYLTHGERMAAHPVIGDALLFLSLAVSGLGRQQDFTALSRWLLSPYWAGADTEHASRALLEQRLRESGQYRRKPADVVRWAHRGVAGQNLDVLLACCSRVNATINPRRQGDSAAHFHAVLQAWGWPGPLARGEDVCRLVKQFGKLLERLRGSESTSTAAALDSLVQLCADTEVEFRGGPLSPVQIISPEDAVGRRFEAARVLNVHDGNWPAHPTTNPFLPAMAINVIPRCSASGETDYCERLTRHMIRLAPNVGFSFSTQTDDIPNQPSPVLLSALGATTPPRGSGPVDTATLSRLAAPEAIKLNGYKGHPWLTMVEDGFGLPLEPRAKDHSSGNIHGGAGVLADQAACPLLGYFRHRLNARFEPMPGPFADAAWRGKLMHTAMHHLFAQHLGQAGVPGAQCVPGAVAAAMEKCRAARRLLPVSLDAERLRLDGLLRQWLEFETHRENFTVEWLEHGFSGELAGFPVSVRADRIDRLADGSLMIIDYKSSPGTTAMWARDRLQLPQLPFYTVSLNSRHRQTVSAVALAAVRSGECELSGICRDSLGAFSKVESFDNKRRLITRQFHDWDALMRHWRRGIEQLAQEFVQGVSANCVHYPEALVWSGMDVLLRRQEGADWLAEHGGQGSPGEGDE